MDTPKGKINKKTEETKMEIKNINEKQGLELLYNQDALTIEGLTPESIPDFVEWFTENGGEYTGVYQFNGRLMNTVYGLTDTNAYPDDLNFAAITYDKITTKVILGRFEFGGRWFSDIVDNNARRENGAE